MSGYDQNSIISPIPTITGTATLLGGPFPIKPSECYSSALVSISGLATENISFDTSPDGYWGAPNSPTFYVTDWQGTQLQYSTARTNFCTYSQALDNAAWTNFISGTGVNPTVTADYAAGPDGTTTAERIQFNQGAGTAISDYSLRKTPTMSGLTVGLPTVVSFWAKSNVASQNLYLGQGSVGSGNGLVTLDTTLRRYSVNLGNASSASGYMYFGLRGTFTTGSTADITITDFQVEQNAGGIATAFIYTNAAAVTTTDYTLSGTGLVTFAVAPVSGALISYDNGGPAPGKVFASGDGAQTVFIYDGMWGTLASNANKINGVYEIDLRGAQALRLTKSGSADTATVNMTFKRDALQYKNAAGVWTVT